MHKKHLLIAKSSYQKVESNKINNNKEISNNKKVGKDKNIGNNKNVDNNKDLTPFAMSSSFLTLVSIFSSLLAFGFNFFSLKIGNINNKIFFNDENKEKLMFAFEKLNGSFLKI